jgi:Zn-finger nucleic acid-binding protein
MSDFCSRYEPLWLDKEDFNNIIEIRKKYNVMNKYIDYHTINAKEFDLCQ